MNLTFEDAGMEYLRREVEETMAKALNAQHDAIDILFAMLIERDPKFFPSKSGKPWDAMVLGNNALARWKELEQRAQQFLVDRRAQQFLAAKAGEIGRCRGGGRTG